MPPSGGIGNGFEEWSDEIPLFDWLPSVIVSLICFVITMMIFNRERRKRNQPEYLESSKYLSISSYLCILIGPVNTLIRQIRFFPGICLARRFLIVLDHFQFAAMECYQLSLLYYSFSQKQIHSNKVCVSARFCFPPKMESTPK